MPVDVSVLIPLYGDHEGRHTLAEASRAWLRQSIPCEVVVAISGNPDVTVAEDVDTDRAVRLVPADPADRPPGLLRNTAAAHARAPVLYLTDADVLPLGRDFPARALDLAGGGPAGRGSTGWSTAPTAWTTSTSSPRAPEGSATASPRCRSWSTFSRASRTGLLALAGIPWGRGADDGGDGRARGQSGHRCHTPTAGFAAPSSPRPRAAGHRRPGARGQAAL